VWAGQSRHEDDRQRGRHGEGEEERVEVGEQDAQEQHGAKVGDETDGWDELSDLAAGATRLSSALIDAVRREE
jgi:hypothetical protein